MFFLLRVAFWLCIVLILLPVGRPDQPTQTKEVGPVEAVTAASAAISDLGSFCDRQPGACAVGSQAAATLAQRAQAGAKMLYEFLTEKLASQEGTAAGSRRAVRPGSMPAAHSPQHTLTPADLAPAWRGPGRTDGRA
jgi:Family of unknown function (DUF5330)